MRSNENLILIIAGTLSFLIALLHIGFIFLGAPVGVAFAFATVYFIMGIYAFSGTGVIPRLPFLDFVLVISGGIYIVQGLRLFSQLYRMLQSPGSVRLWALAFSLTSLINGILYFIGATKRVRRKDERP